MYNKEHMIYNIGAVLIGLWLRYALCLFVFSRNMNQHCILEKIWPLEKANLDPIIETDGVW